MSNEFWDEVASLVTCTPAEPIEYRLHYTETGDIYMCTMQDHPAGTAYVTVSRSEYERYFDYQVVGGQLKKIERDAGHRVKLQRSDQGYRVVQNHAGLLLLPDEDYNNTEYYEYRNN
jgi:hypothetical protein